MVPQESLSRIRTIRDWDRGLSIGFLVHGSDLCNDPDFGLDDATELAHEVQEITCDTPRVFLIGNPPNRGKIS